MTGPKKYLIPLLFIILAAAAAGAQEPGLNETQRELIYTFVGGIAGFGYNSGTYRDSFNTNSRDFCYQGSKPDNGINFSGGAAITIFGQYFVGDFTAQFMYNSGAALSVYHLYFTASARYNFRFGDTFHIAPGAGVFLETPPSNKDFNGSAGFIVPVGFYLNTTFDTKLYLDIYARYGTFGVGQGSTRLSCGIIIGFIFKVGRI
ncbi:MAG: hypothetical protein JXA20_01270 [Spirochaetes bacterium]|nr:hypothetical protein [Spirochaetota bacterium]